MLDSVVSALETKAKLPFMMFQRAKTALLPAASMALPASMRAPLRGLLPAAKATKGCSAMPLTGIDAGPAVPVNDLSPAPSKVIVEAMFPAKGTPTAFTRTSTLKGAVVKSMATGPAASNR